jgi:hypothetical protein
VLSAVDKTALYNFVSDGGSLIMSSDKLLTVCEKEREMSLKNKSHIYPQEEYEIIIDLSFFKNSSNFITILTSTCPIHLFL